MIGHAARTIAAQTLHLPEQQIRDTWELLHTEGVLAYHPTQDQLNTWIKQASANLTGHPSILDDLNRASLRSLVGLTPDPAEWHASRHLLRCAPFHATAPQLNLPTDRPLRIGIDMDDVTYGWTDMIRTLISEQAGVALDQLRVKEHYDFFDGWAGMSKDEVLAVYRQAVTSRLAYTTGPARPGACAGFAAIKAHGHSPIVITARTSGPLECVTEDTLAWLGQQAMTPDEFHVTADKNSVDFDVIFEDSVTNAMKALEDGREALLFSHVFNHDVPDELEARRVYGWDHALSVLGITPATTTLPQPGQAA